MPHILSLAAHVCNASTQEAKAGESVVQDQSGLHSKTLSGERTKRSKGVGIRNSNRYRRKVKSFLLIKPQDDVFKQLDGLPSFIM